MENCSPIRSNPQYFYEPSEAGTSQPRTSAQQGSQEAPASPSGLPRDNPSPALLSALKDLPHVLKVKVTQHLDRDRDSIVSLRSTCGDFRAAGAEAVKHVRVEHGQELGDAIAAYKEGGITTLTVAAGDLTDNHLSALLSNQLQLENLRKLERLNLDGCELLTNEGLKHLCHLTSLRHLDLRGCLKLTIKGVEDLRSQLENCVVTTRRGGAAQRPMWADGVPPGC